MKVQKYQFQKLTPKNDIDLGIYDDAIEYAFANDDICNIAISGPYGAGKSSVIESYKRKHQNRKFINISLAHFTNTNQDDEISETDLEGQIINQLVHQIPSEQIPQTNFDIKEKVDEDNILKYSAFIVAFFLLCCFTFLHNAWCNIVEHLSNRQLSNALLFTTKKEAVLISGIVGIVLLCYISYGLVKQQMNGRFFTKLHFTAHNVNVELFGREDASYFDKYLNEVLYLFENTGVDAIVFEDLDRYDSSLIFEKLRQINTLLNKKSERNFEKDKKIFRFFFLLRDDIFITKERTKFFDYIIPVVSVITGSNSYDMFIEYFNENKITDRFEPNFLQGLSLYIDDIRILKNIVNEYLIYYEKVNAEETQLNDNKLLAMIAYKNMFPRDFVELQTSRGYVYQLFQIKDKFNLERMKILEENITKLENIEAESTREMCRSLDELDAIFYVDNKRTQVNKKSADQFSTRTEYIAEIKKNNYIIQEEERYYNNIRWNEINIKDRFDALLSNAEYMERKQKIENRSQSQRELRQAHISEYRRELENLKYAYLKDIITRENENDIFTLRTEDAKDNLIDVFFKINKDPYYPLIKYLVRNGYIDETYPDYMTFFYPNSISRQDKIFLRSITDKNAKDYNYELDNVKLVISRIRMTDFEEKECRNYNLLDALLESPREYQEQIRHFMYGLWNWEPDDFVDKYINKGKNVQTFANELNKEISSAVRWILDEDRISEESRRQYILATLCGVDEDGLLEYNRGGELVNYINQCDDFLAISNPNISKIIDRFQVLEIKFASINFESANKELLQAVYSNHMYELTQEMIYYYLEYMYRIPFSVKYSTQRLTLILSEEQPLMEYVKDNLDAFIRMQIDEDDILEEAEDTVIYVLNEENIDRQTKINYIKLLKTKLSGLMDVVDNEFWEFLLPNNVVDDSKNIFDYFFFSGNGLDDKLENYMNRCKASLILNMTELDVKYGENAKDNLFWAVIKSNSINNDMYKQILKSVDIHPKSMTVKGISKEKMQILIQEEIPSMTLANLRFLRANYKDSVRMFIEKNIQDYIGLMTEKELPEEEAAYVLDMNISDEQKIALLKLETEPISVMHKGYSSAVLVYILQNLLDENEKEQLYHWYPDGMPEVQKEIRRIALKDIKRIISENVGLDLLFLKDLFSEPTIALDDKKTLLANAIPNLAEREMRDCLGVLHLENFSSLFEGKRPTFEKTVVNENLLTAFYNRNWISSFEVDKENGTLYRAYGRKPKETKIS